MARKPTYSELEARVKELELRCSKGTPTGKDKHYDMLFEGASDSIFIIEASRFIECNKMTLRMFGCDKKNKN